MDDAKGWLRIVNTLKAQRMGVRPDFYYADLSLMIFAHHVSEYAYASFLVLESEAPGAVYPLARSAFESLVDIIFLSTSGSEFAFAGTRAYVSARIADYAAHGAHKRAAAKVGVKLEVPGIIPLRERIRRDAAHYDRLSPGKGQLVLNAFDAVKADRARGLKHWTGLSREDIHSALQDRLKDPTISAVFFGIYNELASRAHSGLRLGPYISAKDGRMRIASKPDIPDPFPLQQLGWILEMTASTLSEFFVENPLDAGSAPA